MIHDRQRLAFGFESGDDLRRVHARLDNLYGHLPADGTHLFGQPDLPHAAFTETLQQSVLAKRRALVAQRSRAGLGRIVRARALVEGWFHRGLFGRRWTTP